jgi:hypothetical protein
MTNPAVTGAGTPRPAPIPHEGDTNGAAGAPGAARGERHNRADEKGRKEEILGRQEVQSIIDEGGNDSALDPGSDESTDGHEDQDGLEGDGDAVDHAFLHVPPFPADEEHAHKGGEYRGNEKGHMGRESQSEGGA